MSRVVLSMITVLSLLTSSLTAGGQQGEEVFRTFCWGCHHQTAVAFSSPFEEIASKRKAEEIRAMIVSPDEVSKALGYSRNAMPAFHLSEDNLTAITNYILSYTVSEKEQ